MTRDIDKKLEELRKKLAEGEASPVAEDYTLQRTLERLRQIPKGEQR